METREAGNGRTVGDSRESEGALAPGLKTRGRVFEEGNRVNKKIVKLILPPAEIKDLTTSAENVAHPSAKTLQSGVLNFVARESTQVG